ncbi:LysR family transcriptional regulator [Aneurinibacillus uraniidurans]|uniref:LysR family transcriptional regulator n=1 Tax=Aneurinibacillus uraniidurans TaxID=2966586 RepID=UPI002349A818|nr:LysR family transcriptional regulator [Aneurinibacillus sp. B1]WCN36248.1 LysR family transcriptional regulator [Aneurinibacillus sp. B1]
MELRQLNYFVEVARLENFTRAAERLKIAQPALSQQIRNLEQELGVKLFKRIGRGVTLTEPGEQFYIGAEKTLAEAQRAKDSVKEFTNDPHGKIMIGALESLVQTRLPSLLVAFGKEYPGIKVFIRENTTEPLLEDLQKGELDLALGHTLDVTYSPNLVRVVAQTGICSKPLYQDELVLVVAKGHPLEKRKTISIGELREESFVFFKEGSGIRSQLLAACISEGFDPLIAYECASPRTLVAKGLGVSILPRLMAESPGPTVSILPLDPPLSRWVSVFYVEGRYLSPCTKVFLRFVEKYLGSEIEG